VRKVRHRPTGLILAMKVHALHLRACVMYVIVLVRLIDSRAHR
jgi:hypothetical protein